MKFLFKKKILILLIILLASFLRVTGFNWGLPQKPYYRAGFQDEAFVVNMILTMDPKDYNPHYFINPSFHYYTLILAIKLSHALGYIKNFSQPVLTNLQGHPLEKITLNDYYKIYVVCRLLTVIEGIITILLIYFIGKKLYDETTGLLSAFILSLAPTHIFQSHFFVVDAPALFWAMLALYHIVQMVNKNEISRKWFILNGIFLGLALGSKYMNLLVFFPFLTITLFKKQKEFWENIILTFSIMIIVFLFTTPHSVLSFREFLFGSGSDEFGGILGKKGLFGYNRYPAHPLKPFAYLIYHPLRLPLAILALISLGYIVYRRNKSDKIILSFLLPFYLIMALSPSPHLRHSLPALPFLTLTIGTSVIELVKIIKNKILSYAFIGFTVVSLVYTSLFSLAMLDRMEYPDTRIEVADYLFKNIPAKTSIGAPTSMPFRYTPPIEMPGYDGNGFGLEDEKVIQNFYFDLMKTNYDYYSLLKYSPEYFLITEVECKEFPYNEVGEVNARNFIRYLFKQKDYELIKIFERKYNILGFEFDPHFPNLDWNPVSQKIYLFKKKY